MNQDFLKRMKEYLKDDEYNALVDAYTKNPVRSFRINKIDEETFFKNIKIDIDLGILGKTSLDSASYILKPTLDDYLETDKETRRMVESWI